MNSNQDEFTIRCTYCNIDLLDINDRLPEKTNLIRVKCPKCKNLSFYKRISLDFGITPCMNFSIDEILEEDNKTIVSLNE